MKITTMLQSAGADYLVRMANDWCCPHCFRPLTPSAVRCEPDAVILICERCHQDVLQIELFPYGPTP